LVVFQRQVQRVVGLTAVEIAFAIGRRLMRLRRRRMLFAGYGRFGWGRRRGNGRWLGGCRKGTECRE
jgi:hypothetical protein